MLYSFNFGQVYYQGTNGVFLVYDVVNDKTFESILQASYTHDILLFTTILANILVLDGLGKSVRLVET